MSVLSRVSAPAVNHDLASVVVALLSSPQRPAPRDLPQSVGDQLPRDHSEPATSSLGRLITGPTGVGTSAARIHRKSTAPSETIAATGVESGSELYCPPAVRDDKALGEEVNDRLVDWAEQVGIYPESALPSA